MEIGGLSRDASLVCSSPRQGSRGGRVSPPNRVLQCYNPHEYGVKCGIRVLHRVLHWVLRGATTQQRCKADRREKREDRSQESGDRSQGRNGMQRGKAATEEQTTEAR